MACSDKALGRPSQEGRQREQATIVRAQKIVSSRFVKIVRIEKGRTRERARCKKGRAPQTERDEQTSRATL